MYGTSYFFLSLNCFYTIVLRSHLENFESLWWYDSVLESLQSTKALLSHQVTEVL